VYIVYNPKMPRKDQQQSQRERKTGKGKRENDGIYRSKHVRITLERMEKASDKRVITK